MVVICNCCLLKYISSFVPLSLCLSLSLFVSISLIRIHRFFITTECCMLLHTDGFIPNIWYQSVGGFSTRCRPSSYTTQHSVFSFFLEEQSRKKTNKKFASHCVKSQIRVSRLVVLCPCECNCLKGTPCATTNTIVLH